jgi:hypothetical protein
MPDQAKPLAYICECGRKWVFSKDDANTSRLCGCGRIIVVRDQAVYTQASKVASPLAMAGSICSPLH